jgi:hypothetical protein
MGGSRGTKRHLSVPPRPWILDPRTATGGVRSAPPVPSREHVHRVDNGYFATSTGDVPAPFRGASTGLSVPL